jgi:hypothetical protein
MVYVTEFQSPAGKWILNPLIRDLMSMAIPNKKRMRPKTIKNFANPG